jgi:NTE family protein
MAAADAKKGRSGVARPRIGLALGAGGTKGTAHVGVLKVLTEAGVPIDCVAGASIGALYGASYALGHDLRRVERNIRRTPPADVLRFFRHRLVIGGQSPLGERFRRALAGARFEDLKVPLAVVASDVLRREPVLIREGDVLTAVQASISLPVLARPVRREGRYLLDGGYWEPAPVSAARALGAQKVIAVVLGEPAVVSGRRRYWLRRLTALVERCARLTGSDGSRRPPGLLASAALYLYARTDVPVPAAEADVVIRPRVAHLNANSPFHMQLSLRRGEEAARQALPMIQEMLRKSCPALRSGPGREVAPQPLSAARLQRFLLLGFEADGRQ